MSLSFKKSIEQMSHIDSTGKRADVASLGKYAASADKHAMSADVYLFSSSDGWVTKKKPWFCLVSVLKMYIQIYVNDKCFLCIYNAHLKTL